jgi:NADH dehydrogenase
MERFSWFPLTKDQLTMLMEGNSCDGREIFDMLGIRPIDFEVDNLGYLKQSG